MKIAVLGAGAYGQVLGRLAEQNGHTVVFYDPYKFPRRSLKTATRGADAMLYVAPANAATELAPQLPLGVPLICASKGFLSDWAFREFADFTALGGAGFASDFQNLLQSSEGGERASTAPSARSSQEGSASTAPSARSSQEGSASTAPGARSSQDQDSSTSDAAQGRSPITLTTSSRLAEEILKHAQINFEYTEDTLGIMLCGALKNVYALGAGLLDCNTSTYLDLAQREMAQILLYNDADPDTVQLACGGADLKLTCTADSRNYRFGQLVAELHKQSLTDQHFFGKVAPRTLRRRLDLPKLAAKQTIEALSVIRSLDSSERFLVPPSARLFITIVNQMQPVVDSLKTASKASSHKTKPRKPTRARAGKTARERAAARLTSTTSGKTTRKYMRANQPTQKYARANQPTQKCIPASHPAQKTA